MHQAHSLKEPAVKEDNVASQSGRLATVQLLESKMKWE